ncbi:MAG: hypothetical protein ACRDZ8_12030 [Acidimicrobiales bacterium]
MTQPTSVSSVARGVASPGELLRLQRLVGNQVVTRLLSADGQPRRLQRDIEQGSRTGWGMWGAAKDPLWVKLSDKFNVQLAAALGRLEAVPARQADKVTAARETIEDLQATYKGAIYKESHPPEQLVSAQELLKLVEAALDAATDAVQTATGAEEEEVRQEQAEAERLRQEQLAAEAAQREREARRAAHQERLDTARAKRERRAKEKAGRKAGQIANTDAINEQRAAKAKAALLENPPISDDEMEDNRRNVALGRLRIELSVLTGDLDRRYGDELMGAFREKVRAAVPGVDRRLHDPMFTARARARGDVVRIPFEVIDACLADVGALQRESVAVWSEWGPSVELLATVPTSPSKSALRDQLRTSDPAGRAGLLAYVGPHVAHLELALQCLAEATLLDPGTGITRATKVLELLVALPDGEVRTGAQVILASAPADRLDALVGYMRQNRSRIDPALDCLRRALATEAPDAVGRATADLDALAPFNFDRKLRDTFAGLTGSAIDTDVATKVGAIEDEGTQFALDNRIDGLNGQKKTARKKLLKEKEEAVSTQTAGLKAGAEGRKKADMVTVAAFLSRQKFSADASAVATWAVGFAAADAAVLKAALDAFELCAPGTTPDAFTEAATDCELTILSWALPLVKGNLTDAVTLTGLRKTVAEKPLAALLKNVALPTVVELVAIDSDATRLEKLRKQIGDGDGTVLLELLEPIGSSNATFPTDDLATLLGYLCADGLKGTQVLEILVVLSDGGLGKSAIEKRLKQLRGTTYVPTKDDDDHVEARNLTNIPTRSGADILANKAAKAAGQKFLSGEEIYLQVVAARDAIDVSVPKVDGVADTAAPRGVDTLDTHYPTGHEVASRSVAQLWKDADPASTKLDNLGQRDTEETDAEQAIRVKMAYKALLNHPTLQKERVKKVYAYDYGRSPRPIFSPYVEDKLGGGTAHIVQRHVLGTPGIQTQQHVRDRANGLTVNGIPPGPGIAGAFTDAAAAQTAIQAALTSWVNAAKANWRTMRSEIVTGAAVSTIDRAFAASGFCHRSAGAVDVPAPTQVHVVFNGDDVDGGFYVQSAWPVP